MIKNKKTKGLSVGVLGIKAAGLEVVVLIRPSGDANVQTYKNEFLKNIKYFSEIAKEKVAHGYVIYGGETIKKDKAIWRILNYKYIQKIVSEN